VAALSLQLQGRHAKLAQSEAVAERMAATQDMNRQQARQLHDLEHELDQMRLAVEQVTQTSAAAMAEQTRLESELEHGAEEKVAEAVKHARQASVAARVLAACQRLRIDKLTQLYREEAATRRKLYNEVQDAKGNIRVFCRCRPLLPFEKQRGDSPCVEVIGSESVRLPDKTGHSLKSYSFSSCFGPEDTQEHVFGEAYQLVQSVFDGFNVCVFAYGQTGSGKTHTMYGDQQQPGVAPRTIEAVWRHVPTCCTRQAGRVIILPVSSRWNDCGKK
jgi:regulator of replication initiation timing